MPRHCLPALFHSRKTYIINPNRIPGTRIILRRSTSDREVYQGLGSRRVERLLALHVRPLIFREILKMRLGGATGTCRRNLQNTIAILRVVAAVEPERQLMRRTWVRYVYLLR